MKLQIDTTNKIIRLEQSAKITELFTLVKKLFPNDEWKQYSLEAVQYISNWYNPIFIPSVWYTADPAPFTFTTSAESETFCIQTN